MDFEKMARGIVASEQYEIIECKPGEYVISLEGAALSVGCVCKFPKREGRDHIQRERARRMSKVNELIAALQCIQHTRILTVTPEENEAVMTINRILEELEMIPA